jgi:hypothetical protein
MMPALAREMATRKHRLVIGAPTKCATFGNNGPANRHEDFKKCEV